MKLFVDTGNLKEIEALAALGILDGVTTNPSLLAKETGDYRQILKQICRTVQGPVSAEVVATDAAGMIREGRDFEVVDAKSGEDITHQVLTQIIVEEEARGTTMLPVNFLRQLIGLYGDQMQSAVPNYLDAAMDAFRKNQQAVAGAFTGNNFFADMAKRNMAMFEDAAGKFGGAAPKAAPAGKDSKADDELAKLKAELAALQAKVDKIGK